ncbi:hypothetical protein Q7P37_005980 [Cladosporium fusiforme]
MADQFDALKEGFARLHKSEKFSDCTIICGPYQFKAHKSVLSVHSEYFSKAFQSGAFKEGDSGKLELKAAQSDSDDQDACDDPEIVKLMIHYFYHLDYLNDEDAISKNECHLIEHAKTFAIAVKYQVQGLRTIAHAKFKLLVLKSLEHDDFSHAIHIVYTSTADNVTELRDIVANTIHANIDKMRKKPEVQALLSSIPGLAYCLLERNLDETKRRPLLIARFATVVAMDPRVAMAPWFLSSDLSVRWEVRVDGKLLAKLYLAATHNIMNFAGGYATRAVQAGLPEVYRTGQFTDAVISCGPHHLKVHKVILAVHSEYFAKAFQADAPKEGNSGQIVLQAAEAESNDPEDACDDPETVKLMVDYSYNYDYHPAEETLMIHAKMFAMAVKYQIAGLRDLARDKFKDMMNEENGNMNKDFVSVLSFVYRSTPDDVVELQHLAISNLNKNYDELRDDQELEFLLRNLPGLAYDLLESTRPDPKERIQTNRHRARGHATEGYNRASSGWGTYPRTEGSLVYSSWE